MATPLGHSLAGYAIASFSTGSQGRDRWQLTALCMLMAVAPDLDLLPGLLQGKLVLYHGSISHSLGAGLLASLALAGLFKLRGRSFRAQFGWFFGAYASHLILDFFGPDGRPPYGIPLFWPLSGAYFISPIPLLLGARHVSSTTASTLEFVRGVFSVYNVLAIGLEVAIIAPFILWGKWFRKRRATWKASIGLTSRQLEERKV